MAEETQTPELEQIDDTLTQDDTDTLRYVLKNTRGATAVSTYNQSLALDDGEVE